MSFKCTGNAPYDCTAYGNIEGKTCKSCSKSVISKNAHIDWVFWVNISIRRKWFCFYWKIRGANFLEIQIWKIKISVGMPWLNSYCTYIDYLDSNIYNTNKDNLRNRFSFLVKSKY